MHPSYVVMNGIGVTFAIMLLGFVTVFGAVVEAMLISGNGLQLVVILIGSFIGLLAITMTISYIYYKRFRWEITDSDIHIYSGILFKKQTHIPFQRVQSIDFSAGIPQRVLGIVRLKIETAGGAANKAAVIPALKLSQAEAFRVEVFTRKKSAVQQSAAASPMVPGVALPFAQPAQAIPGGVDPLVRQVGDSLGGMRGLFADDYDETAPIECEYSLSAKEIFLTALAGDHNILFTVFLIVGLTQLGSIASLFDLERAFPRGAGGVITDIVVPMIAGGLIFFALVVFVSGIFGTAVQFGGFKARRRGGRIEVEMGLLSRQYKGVSINRIQSLEIRQGAIRRLMGYGELRLHTVDTLQNNQNKKGAQAALSKGLIIHPFIKLSSVESILHQMVPEFDGRCTEGEFRRLPPVALRRVLIRHVGIFAVFFAAVAAVVTAGINLSPAEFTDSDYSWIVSLLWVLLGVFTIGRSVAAVLWYRQAAYAYNTGMLTIRSGYFSVSSMIIAKRRIQWAQTRQNPFQRLSHVASIGAVTAAGVGGTKTVLRDLSVEEASAYLDWIRPTASSSAT